MKFISVRDLRNSTSKLDEMIANNGSVVVTNSGKPAYLLLGVDEESFEDTIFDLVRLRAMRATRKIQSDAKRGGQSKLTPAEIDAEIDASRKERRMRENG